MQLLSTEELIELCQNHNNLSHKICDTNNVDIVKQILNYIDANKLDEILLINDQNMLTNFCDNVHQIQDEIENNTEKISLKPINGENILHALCESVKNIDILKTYIDYLHKKGYFEKLIITKNLYGYTPLYTGFHNNNNLTDEVINVLLDKINELSHKHAIVTISYMMHNDNIDFCNCLYTLAREKNLKIVFQKKI